MALPRTRRPSTVVVAVGVALFLLAVVHHTRELLALEGVLGPTVALAIDGLPALGLAVGGVWLSRRTLDLTGRNRVLW
jgi:hypothetical protein